jgi:hypothetical protein
MRSWSPRRWVTALGAAVVIALLLGLPTDVIPNPVFGRPVPVTWWSVPVLIISAVLAGLLVATYVRDDATKGDDPTRERIGGLGGLLTFFAIGCPVCNKLVVVALGTTGALDWFAPTQPWLAVISIALLVEALRRRLRTTDACRVETSSTASPSDEPANMSS